MITWVRNSKPDDAFMSRNGSYQAFIAFIDTLRQLLLKNSVILWQKYLKIGVKNPENTENYVKIAK